MNINTFIFDLGGVIIDLNENATTGVFAKLSHKTEEEVNQMYLSTDAFLKYEKGFLTDAEFRSELKKVFGTNIKDQSLDEAWNAMLGEVTMERLNLLSRLRTNHKVLILSNTNNIHVLEFNKILEKVSGKNDLSHFTDFVFYSHELGMRKPDVEIYTEILKQSDTKATEALFMDDKKENLLAAESVGIQTKQIMTPNQIFELERYVG